MKVKENGKFVAYLRVSTQRQGFSGLGLDAQREIIRNYLHDTNLILEYVEVESGRKTDKERPQPRSRRLDGVTISSITC